MISEDNMTGFSGRAEHHLFQISQDRDDEVFSPADKETFNTAIEDDRIKDLNNNSDNEWL